MGSHDDLKERYEQVGPGEHERVVGAYKASLKRIRGATREEGWYHVGSDDVRHPHARPSSHAKRGGDRIEEEEVSSEGLGGDTQKRYSTWPEEGIQGWRDANLGDRALLMSKEGFPVCLRVLLVVVV